MIKQKFHSVLIDESGCAGQPVDGKAKRAIEKRHKMKRHHNMISD